MSTSILNVLIDDDLFDLNTFNRARGVLKMTIKRSDETATMPPPRRRNNHRYNRPRGGNLDAVLKTLYDGQKPIPVLANAILSVGGSASSIASLISRQRNNGLLQVNDDGTVALTHKGKVRAAKLMHEE
jgi:hypothetical protein